MKLLHIIATPRGENSRTLQISKEFLKAEIERNNDLEIETLDLSIVKLPTITGAIADAKYVMMKGDTLSEQTQKEVDAVTKYALDFLAYDAYLISSPMWNFTVPYQLKHYIDIVMQPGILFRFTQHGVEGLAKNKKLHCITTRGSDYSPNTYLHQYDFQEPYLRAIFGMAGIVDVTFINAQPMDYSPELRQLKLDEAIAEVKMQNIAAQLAELV